MTQRLRHLEREWLVHTTLFNCVRTAMKTKTMYETNVKGEANDDGFVVDDYGDMAGR